MLFINNEGVRTEMLKLRETSKEFIKFSVGDGKSIHLWMNWWLRDGVLYDKYGFRAVTANLESVLKGR
jgi:hypothetical protein